MRIKVAILILLLAPVSFAQAPWATKRPLDQVQVLALLAGGGASQRVAMHAGGGTRHQLRAE